MTDMPVFSVGEGEFLLDGMPYRILSGAVHYFRVHPDQWEHRLAAARAMGLNTVETYLPWNLHEPEPGRHDFDGGLDVERFVRLAQEAGLYVLLRPGPYICAEFELGGLPWWLLRDPEMRLRSSQPQFLAAVDAWFDVLIPKLVPLLTTRGGPGLMVQVENEFGSYGADPEYLRHLTDGLLARGVDVPLFTSDGPEDHMLANGPVPGVTATVNFGSRAPEAFEALRRLRPTDPLMCMEFWCGWFDHWGEEHHTRDAEDAAATLDDILSAGASVNFYMWHGGTNFGYTSGANHPPEGPFEPTITSYDYDAPLTEWGAPGEKFAAFRDVIAKHVGELPSEEPPPVRLAAHGEVRLDAGTPLLSALTPVGEFDLPPTVEEAGIGYGIAVYRAELPEGAASLEIPVVHDRALVFVDGVEAGVLERDGETALALSGGRVLEIVLENLGRVNYGPHLHDRKGFPGGVLVDGEPLRGWTVLRPSGIPDAGEPGPGPLYRRGAFTVTEVADTFLDLPGFVKGEAWVNGFHLGRFWDRGPQTRLYVPGPVLRRGDNEVVLLDLHPGAADVVSFVAEPGLG